MPITLSPYALLALEDLKGYLTVTGSTQDENLKRAINGATAWMEQRLGRQLVSRGELVEYHTLRRSTTSVRLSEWPTLSVVSVHESLDWPRVWDETTLLVVDEDYTVDGGPGRLRRVGAGGLRAWPMGYRAIKVVHTAGYATAAEAPADLQQVALYVATAMFKEADRESWGVSSRQDAMGNVMRFMGYLPPTMQDKLDTYRRQDWDERTWERAA